MDHVLSSFRKAQTYAKAIVASVGSVLVAIVGLGEDLGVNLIAPELQAIAAFILVALTAFSTWAIPNYEPEVEE